MILFASCLVLSYFVFEMLYLVGLGLADETDITVKGLEVVKKAERVYLEAYTSILLVSKEKLVSGLLLFYTNSIDGALDSLAKNSVCSLVGKFLRTSCHSSRQRTSRKWQ